MRIPRRWSSTALALAVISMGSACADDTPATTIDFGDGTSSTAGTSPTTSVTEPDSTATDGGATDSATGTATAGDTEDTATTTGGVEAFPGQTVSQLVTAGERSTSRTYVLVFTVGQPSQLQSTHESASYHLRGGLVGANGSPP
jgi:hypothetical protein